MTAEALSDDQLARQVMEGSTEAMETLVQRYYHKIYTYCARHVGNAGAAQDITQEVFLKVLQSIDSYRPRGAFGGWLMTIAVNTCRTYLSSAYHRHGSLSMPIDSLNLLAEGSVEESAEQSELSGRVRAALLKLPAVQREALLLRFYDDYTLAEIARITGAPLPTVKYRVRQACKRLKVLLKEDLYEE